MKLSTRLALIWLLALIVACPVRASAQWSKKPYIEWSEGEAQKVLDDSPWGRTQVFSDPTEMFRRFPNQGPVAEAGRVSIPNSLHINFRIRFLSAKPVRLAVSRLLELKQKDNISQELAERIKAFATGAFFDYIVITVSCDSRQPGANFQEAQGLLYSRGTAELKNNTFLEIKGGRRLFLLQYQTPRSDGLGARFIFPRLVDGEPFITEDSGEVRFYSEMSGTFILNRRYKIKDMIFDGKLEY